MLGVTTAVLVGLERDETPESLRRLIERVGIRYDTEFSPSSQLRYASAALRAAAGNHEGAVEELAAAIRRGEIWIAENPYAADGQGIRWTRFATSLHEPLGLSFHEGALFTTQRTGSFAPARQAA